MHHGPWFMEQRLIWSLPVSPNRVFIGKSFRSRHLFFWCLFLQVLFQLFYQSEFLSLWESQTPMIILSLNALTNYFKVPVHGWKRDLGTQIFRLLKTHSLDLHSHYNSCPMDNLSMFDRFRYCKNAEFSISSKHWFTRSESEQVSLV